MTGSDTRSDSVGSVQQVPICPGCGLMSHITHGDICVECFNRREGWLGGGLARYVTEHGTYHETPACPGFGEGKWRTWKDEECCYADLGGDLDRCHRCYSYRTFGFDHYDEDATVVGHA